MDGSKHWTDKLQKFKDVKRKTANMDELIQLAESMANKIASLKSEAQAKEDADKKEIEALKSEVKDLRDELDIAWKNV